MAYYPDNVTPNVAAANGFAAPQYPQQPNLELISLNQSDSINNTLHERQHELRLEGLVHVFLTKKTPLRSQPDLELIEATLLSSLVNCTEDVLNAYNRGYNWKTIFTMKEWRRLQLLMEYGTDTVFTTSLSNALWNLPTDRKLPLYIRRQNATIIFTKTCSSHTCFKLETFQASLPSDQIMSTVGSLLVTYPQTVDYTVNVDLLCSPYFLMQIRDLTLNEYEVSLPKVRKGGQDFGESREVPEPFLVTELLTGMLSDGEALFSPRGLDRNEAQFTITKKVRDTVEWRNCVVPFRRSGLWMSAKVLLQLCLLQDLHKQDAKLIYKLILLRLMYGLCAYRANVEPEDLDLMHQMLSKVAKRAKKLDAMNSTASINEALAGLKQNILKDAYKTITECQAKMDFLWAQMCNKEDTIEFITRSLTEFQTDLYHDAHLLEEYCKTPLQPIREEEHDGINDIVGVSRMNSWKKISSTQINWGVASTTGEKGKTDEHLDDEIVWLHDIENLDMLSKIPKSASCMDIYQLFLKYTERAIKRYSITTAFCPGSYRCHDPVSFSRMVFTLLTLYKKLDQIAVERHPMLLEYGAGINWKIFSKLLVGGSDGVSSLEDVDDLEKYFMKRNMDAKFNSIVYSSRITPHNFSVRYAKQCDQMVELREKILRDTTTGIERKWQEIERVKRDCENLEKKILAMDHSFNLDTGVHLRKCDRCHQSSIWNRKKLSVRRYEKPLPKLVNCQWALVFELLIPVEISVLRDALLLIGKEVLSLGKGKDAEDGWSFLEDDDGTGSGGRGATNWLTSYKPIKEYTRSDIRYSELIRVGSTAKPVSVSHYNKSLDVFVTPRDYFIIENGMNCGLYHVPKLTDYQGNTDPFSFQIGTAHDEERLYKNLQFAVSGTAHTQNYVIAEQSTLNTGGLPVSEYLAFGSLRSGHRLQLRNLYKFLSEKNLNIEKEPVLALILQSIWSTGKLETGEQETSRTTQSDFSNVDFSSEFLNLLEDIVTNNAHNWSSPCTLLISVVIILQILKYGDADTIRSVGAKLLKKIRIILNGWVHTVESQLSFVPAQDPVQRENEQLFLKTRILESLIASAFTYSVTQASLSVKDQSEVSRRWLLPTAVEVSHYLQVLSGMHYYVNVEKVHKRLSPFMQILLKMARLRIPLDLEKHLHHRIQELDVTCVLLQFVNAHWKKSLSTTSAAIKTSTWRKCIPAEKKHVYQGHIDYVNGTMHNVHLDVIGGTFLVDSYPPTHLPRSISQDSLFQRYFGNQYGENFRVQRDATTFTTQYKINGRYYSFFQATHNGKLICVCRELQPEEMEDDEVNEGDRDSEGDNYLELLDPEIFRMVLASPFVENYTHWLNPRSMEVYFRKRVTTHSRMTSTTNHDNLESAFLDPDYRMVRDASTGSWTLVHHSEGKFVLSIVSRGYVMLSQILSRIEEWRYINILWHTRTTTVGANGEISSSPRVSVSLPRLGLNFTLEDGLLQSVEYPDYYISLNQCKGTLVGLRNALLLEKPTVAEVSGVRQLILVPHGVLGNDSVSQYQYHHGTVIRNDESNNGMMRQPPFFVYEVDTLLKRLKADKNSSAWLYLAALHGATASCLPDPLTSLTGTEMAMWILQSGLVWSSSPFDFECKRTLLIIQNFSPDRDFYPPKAQNMEQIRWLASFPSYAAFDGYEILVQKLLEDSERLQDLFLNKRCLIDDGLYIPNTGRKILRLRGYLRHQFMYNPVAHLCPTNFPTGYSVDDDAHKELQLTVRRSHDGLLALREISQARRTNSLSASSSPPNVDLIPFLITPEEVTGFNGYMELLSGGTINLWMGLSTRKDWLRLYNLAWCAEEQNLHGILTLILCTLAYQKESSPAQLLNIHLISRFRYSMALPHPLSSELPFAPSNYQVLLEPISNLLRTAAVPFSITMVPPAPADADMRMKREHFDRHQAGYEQMVLQEITQLTQGLLQLSRGPNFNGITIQNYFTTYIQMCPWSRVQPFMVLVEIQTLVSEWLRNLQFKYFVTQVHKELAALYNGPLVQRRSENRSSPQQTDVAEVTIILTREMDRPLNLTLSTYFTSDESMASRVSGLIYSSGRLIREDGGDFEEDIEEPFTDFNVKRLHLLSMMMSILDKLTSSVLPNDLAKCLNTCGLFPRLVPLHLLPYLTTAAGPGFVHEEILNDIGAMGVLHSHIKRMNRCIKYGLEEPQRASELERELENRGHVNWSPKLYPEWLLLEVDMDLMIRPVQVEVAQQMIQMPDGGNGVMQLNMGEGKTSLIVPMLVSFISRERNTICRVTVLNSIYKTNLDLLSHAIGGLLNRKVYGVPCRRDAKIKECLPKIWQVYQECMEGRGCVLTLAEFRLSPRLMAYEKLLAYKNETISFGLELLELEKWLRDHCRDIMDESDELLSAKYQLIYTTGTQLSLSGGTNRWLTCQKILNLIPEVVYELSRKYGEIVVEFEKKTFVEYPEQFTPCRLLSDQCQAELYELLADRILQGKSSLLDVVLGVNDYQVTKQFLTNRETTKEIHDAVLEIFKDDQERLERILLISGYLRRGILHLALSKRWRVEYGVDPRGRRKMAVPFRAKDVAAERTEFGHPDVGIVLTHLSYYYSGLSDEQLMEAFLVLKSAPGQDQIYQEWMSPLQKGRVEPSIKSLKGVNLRDFKQRTVDLFPVLRKNKRVIDFWLANKVFPQESKQFPRKIVTTAWDLCYERNRHPTTGFSGTNDCSVLLPLPIKQQDLDQLQETNRTMEQILKRPENSITKTLGMGITCREILQYCQQDGARVLIDAGALMLQLGNEQVAQLWLEIDVALEGVVYFNDKNELLVKVRRASNFTTLNRKKNCRHRRPQQCRAADIPLEVSPYRERLEKCAIFLDDQHTRGTDLKFPNGFKGCVTVGSRMKRDKLIQAALRMRKLGAGHSVIFYLSREVSNKIRKMLQENVPRRFRKFHQIVTEDILKWVTENSADFEKEGLIHWALAGKNYAQKLAAEDIFQHTINQSSSISAARLLKQASILGNHCMDEEIVELTEMYGNHLTHELVCPLLEKWFFIRKQKLQEEAATLPKAVEEVYENIQNAVVDKCQLHIPDRTYLANNFEEEQEKELELEPEHEEIRCLKRPKNLKPVEPILHKVVRDFVLSGKITVPKTGTAGTGTSTVSTSELVPLGDVFRNTTFFPIIQPECWKTNIFASPDFVHVVRLVGCRDKLDSYLRPISYLVSARKGRRQDIILLLISPYEANELMTHFKNGTVHASVKLHMFSPRTAQGQNILVNNHKLFVPLPQGQIFSDLGMGGASFSIPDEMLAPLLLASGSLFFGGMGEQKAFARFLGFLPRPWKGTAEQEGINRGYILKSGFLLPKYAPLYESLAHEERDRISTEGGSTKMMLASELNFKEDPSTMVKAILENKHVSLRESSHVMQLLNKCAFIDLDDLDENENDDDTDKEGEQERAVGVWMDPSLVSRLGSLGMTA